MGMRRIRLTRRGVAALAALLLLGFAALRLSGPKTGELIGSFDMSHYCLESLNGEHLCGNSAYGCKGDRLIPGKSLAVPASVLEGYPVGTRVIAVYPDGRQARLIIHDTGRALEGLGRIDLAVKTHDTALQMGVVEGVMLYMEK